MVQKNCTTNMLTQQLALTLEGVSDDEVNAFKIQLGTEVKKPIEQQRFPLYVAEVKAETLLYRSSTWIGSMGCNLGVYCS